MSLTLFTGISTGPGGPSVRPAVPANIARLFFSGKQAPDKLEQGPRIIDTIGCTQAEGKAYLPKLLEARAHAKEALALYPNYSQRHYGAVIRLDNGIEATGTNIEASRQCTLCDLRLGVSSAINKHIEESLKAKEAQASPENQARLEQLSKPARVETIFLANVDPEGEAPIPCADCQEWLNTPVTAPDTRVISLEPAESEQGEQIRVRTVGEMLPLHKGREPVRFHTDKPLSELLPQADWSDRAEEVLAKLSPQKQAAMTGKLSRMLIKAQKAYQQNNSANDSKKRTGVSVTIAPLGLTVSGGRYDWTTRWFEAADLKTAAVAYQLAQHIQDFLQRGLNKLPAGLQRLLTPMLEIPHIQAVAYFGEDPDLPPIPSLGRVGRRRGSSETLILTVENDAVKMRTVGDYMPEMYQTRTGKKL